MKENTFEWFMSMMGTEVFSTVIAFLALGFVGHFVYKHYIKNNNLKEKDRKIKIFEAALLVVGFFEAFVAAFATSDDEGMVFGMRLGLHASMLIINTTATLGIWKEVKEAIIAFQDLALIRKANRSIPGYWGYVVSIIWNFILEWMQVIFNVGIALFAIAVNIYLMGSSTGSLYEVGHLTYMYDIVDVWENELGQEVVYRLNFWEVMAGGYEFADGSINEPLRTDVVGNVFLSMLHVIGILMLGLLSRDTTIKAPVAPTAAVPSGPANATIEQVAGYYSKHIFPKISGSTVTKDHVLDLLRIDTDNMISNQIAMEEHFVAAKNADDIVKDRTLQPADRQAAVLQLKAAHEKMVKLMTKMTDQAAIITAGS